jgi:hypothetical protein
MTMPFHAKPFENKVFKEVFFSPQISPNPPSPQETEHGKRREKVLKKEKKKENEKRERKRKATRVSLNKGKVNILRGEKYFNFKNLFLM